MYYDIVIFGATSAALGIASELRQKYKLLIINKTSMVAYEFINAYKPGINWDRELESELGKAIKKELLGKRIITSQNVHVYSAGPIFYKAFKEMDVDIILETEIVSLQKAEDDYEIAIFNVGGHSTIKSKYIIDTTEQEIEIKSKSLNCLLINKNRDEFPFVAMNGVDFYRERDDTINTVIMKYECPINASLCEARHQLIELWRQRPGKLADWKIAAIGLCFDITPQAGFKQVEKTHIVLPAVYYDNPLAAIDAGVKFGRRMAHDL